MMQKMNSNFANSIISKQKVTIESNHECKNVAKVISSAELLDQ